jgi:hypothetical protein
MKRLAKTIDLGDKVRYVVTLLDVETQSPTDITFRRVGFLQELINDGVYRGMINAGPGPFQKLKMYHNGRQWAIELESEEEKNEG